MKTAHLLLVFTAAIVLAGCAIQPSPLVLQKPTVVEAACGECKFGLKGDDCDLAIRVSGHSYFVDGVSADSLGDAHAANGICETIRKGRFTG